MTFLALGPVLILLLCLVVFSWGHYLATHAPASGPAATPPLPELDGPKVPDAMRASDDDRADAAAILNTALVAGRLTVDEFDERLQATHGARTLGQVRAQLTDLPHTR